MWTAIKAWLDKHSISSKTFVTAWLFVDTLYYTSTQFHDYVYGLFHELPKGVEAFVMGVVVPALVLWKTTHPKAAVPSAPPAPPLNPQLPLNLAGKGD